MFKTEVSQLILWYIFQSFSLSEYVRNNLRCIVSFFQNILQDSQTENISDWLKKKVKLWAAHLTLPAVYKA